MTDSSKYANGRDYLGDALSLLALRLHREVAVLRALRRPGRNESFLGLFLSDEDAEALLRELTGEIAGVGTDALDRAVAALEARMAARLEVTDQPLPFAHICGTFGLSALEFELLIAAAAPAIDDRFGRVYGFLHDDMGRRAFTLTIAKHVLSDRSIELPQVRRLLAEDAPLRDNRLIRGQGEGPLAALPLSVDERIVDILLDQWQPVAVRQTHAAAPAAAWQGLAPMIDHALGEEVPVSVDLSAGGDAGLVASGTAERYGLAVRRFLWRDFAVRPAERVVEELLTALRDARLDAALPYLEGFDEAPAYVQAALAEGLSAPAVLSQNAPLHWATMGLETIEMAPERVPAPARAVVWEAALGDADLAAEMAGLYDLPSLDITDLTAHAGRLGGDRARALKRTAKRRAGQPMAGIAERVETPFGFDDLVLSRATLELLQNFTARRKNTRTVLVDWGLGATFGKGPGTTALFLGPSGTGKTMAASVIANALEVEFFRIDLAGVVSKYIGETEKNLDRVFDAADRSDVVLFFDEADALFGKRSEVSDSHDRYANIEVSYLLQRMESFGGAAILATNLGQNLDEAFMRRIDLVVEFQPPQAGDRMRLWQRLATSGAPLAEDADLGALAEKFELTGGEIRNCCLLAAHIAAAEGTSIAMRHLMRAVGREYVKTGRPLRRAVFGEHYGDLRTGAGGGAA